MYYYQGTFGTAHNSAGLKYSRFERRPELTSVCSSCSTPNPSARRHCHQCGAPLAKAQPPQDAVRPPSANPASRLPPDETRLPPPGSFRSGAYRLVRALLTSQKAPQSARPKGAAPDREVPSVLSSEKLRTPDEAPAPAGPAQRGSESASPPPPGPLPAAVYWLTRALLTDRLLPRTSNPPARLPAPAVTPRGRDLRILTGLGGRIDAARRRAGAATARARQALAPGDGPAVPLYVEAAAVVGLTLLALFLRAWNLPEAPNGIHGDETEMAMEALRSLRGESVGIWTGVTLGNPAGYVHWMGAIFRVAEADVTTMRLASALPGAAVVPVGYLLVRRLFSFRVALLSAALTAVSFWFVIQSRIAFGGITSVFMALLTMWLLAAAVQSRRKSLAVAAGVALGLGLYTFKTFLIYFTGIWAIALLGAIVSGELRRGWEVWLCLGVSVAVGAPMLLFYAGSGYIGPNLNNVYEVPLSAPSTWLKIPGLAVDAVLLANQPVQGDTVDGSPAIPVLPLLASLFFWAGLAVTLLFVRQRRCQLLLAGWVIGMAPILLVPGSESRRYLLGVFFVLVMVSVGADTLLVALARRVGEYVKGRRFSAVWSRRAGVAAAAALAFAFAALFAGQSLRELDRWGDGESVRWFFNYEYHQSLLFLRDLNADLPVRYYTVRQYFDNSIRRFVLPDARGADGSPLFGGGGSIPPRREIVEDTIFVFLDEYLALAATLEAEYPDAVKIGEADENGRMLYVVYLVRANPAAPDGGGPPSRRESPSFLPSR